MKYKKKELDVDFIGGEDPLTKEEENAISQYIKAQKEKKLNLRTFAKRTVTKRDKSLA